MSTAYALVSSTAAGSLTGFVAKVNELLGAGWKLHGPTMHATDNKGNNAYSQAFIKDYPPDPNAK